MKCRGRRQENISTTLALGLAQKMTIQTIRYHSIFVNFGTGLLCLRKPLCGEGELCMTKEKSVSTHQVLESAADFDIEWNFKTLGESFHCENKITILKWGGGENNLLV